MARIRCFDLGELRGYHYHSGVVFAAYAEGAPNALALGGRYDEVGKAFGRARAATGFSVDLRELASVRPDDTERPGMLAPYAPRDAALQKPLMRCVRAVRSWWWICPDTRAPAASWVAIASSRAAMASGR